MTTGEYLDVAVVGGGLSGLVAASRSAVAGLKVAVFERGTEPRYLCASRLTGGVFHVCNTDVRTMPAQLEETIRVETEGFCSPELAKLVAGGALRAVTWLAHVGVRFIRGPYPHLSFMLTPPNVVRVGAAWKGRGGDAALQTLECLLLQHGGKIHRGHAAIGLLSRGNACLGIEVENEHGVSEIRARSVVLADGGFQSSLPLLGRHVSRAPEAVFQRNARRSFGNVLDMVQMFDPAIAGMPGFYGHVLSRSAWENERLWPYPWLDDVVTAGIAVDGGGRRFCDEGLGGVSVANAIARLADPLSATVICDADTWADSAAGLVIPANPYLERLGGAVHPADDLHALALKAGLPASALVAEVNAYNTALSSNNAAATRPPRSAVGPRRLRPIARPPFFAIPACAGITYTMGGPLIDANARLLSRSGQPVVGLYVVGSASGGIEGGPKPGYVGGLIKAAVTGIAAADHIVRIQAAGSALASA